MATDQVSETEQCGTSPWQDVCQHSSVLRYAGNKKNETKNLLSIRHVKRNSTRKLNQIRFNVRALNHM
jgi:hypothetical protein